MGFHIQLDLKAIEQAASVARAAGITLSQQLAGLALMYHHVWAKKSDQATRALLCGWFEIAPGQVDRLVEAQIAFGHLAERSSDLWRIRGAKRYFNLRKKLSEGGQKSRANLKQYSKEQEPAGSGPGEGLAPAPAGDDSAEEDCWDIMERARVEHCERRGIETHFWPRPKRFRDLLLKAVDTCGVMDSIVGGEAFTRWNLLTLLFDRYLGQERIGVTDQKGKPCVPPWPIQLFLSPGVLERFKSDWDAEQAA